MATRATGSATRRERRALRAPREGPAAGGDPPASGRRRRGAARATATDTTHRDLPATSPGRHGERLDPGLVEHVGGGDQVAHLLGGRQQDAGARRRARPWRRRTARTGSRATTRRRPARRSWSPRRRSAPETAAALPLAPSSPLGSGHGSGPHPRFDTGSSTGPTAGLSPAARRGYGLGSVATGSFGTVPGLLLLPYLTDRLGVAAGVAGPGRLPAQGLGRHPQPGRRADQRPLHQPRRAGAGRSSSARARLLALAFVLLFAGPTSPHGRRRHLGRRAVPRLRHGLRVLPGALRRDARRDDRRLRRAHPADDLAGRDPRPRRSWSAAACSPVIRNALGPEWGYRGVGLFVGDPDPRRHGRRVVGHPRRPHGGRRDGRRQPAPTSCGWSAASREFRTLLTVFVLQALATGAMLAGVDYVAPGAARLAGRLDASCSSASSRPALLVTPLWQRVGEARDKRTGYIWGSLLLAGGALATLLTVRVGVAATAASVAVVGRRLRGLPDVPARDAARRRRRRHRPHRREPRRHLHRRLDRRGDPRPRPRPAPVCRRARRWAATSRPPTPPPCSPTRRTPPSPWASPSSRPRSSRSRLLVASRGYRLDEEVSR